jgi:hypothetical protein
MKKLTLIFILLLTHLAYAQVPQGIPYQAAARNASGQALVNTAVKVRFSILDSVATGTVVYKETHSTTTNSVGLFNVNVGMGTAVTGTFSAINWGKNAKFMQMELDITGTGSSYVDMGTQQMLSVPYALYAGNVANVSTISSTISNGIMLTTTTPYYKGQGSTVFVSGGNIVCDGGYPVIQRGICWSTAPHPTMALLSKTIDSLGVGSFTSNIGNVLNAATTYYFRAYIVNSTGTYYGNEVSINTGYVAGLQYGGGIIAYIYQLGDPGYIPGTIHGLIAAKIDQGSAIFGCSGTTIAGTSVALGSGATNTNAIITSCSTSSIAAQLCKSLNIGGYTDWYLPSRDELIQVYFHRALIGGGGFISNANYWSSSDFSSLYAYWYGSNIGTGSTSKNSSNLVRAVRSF